MLLARIAPLPATHVTGTTVESDFNLAKRKAVLPATSPIAVAIARATDVALPSQLSPQLATLAARPPTQGDWRYEIKFDGYRILARIEGGQCRLVTRNGNDWTSKMGSLAVELGRLDVTGAWIDGEAVVLDEAGMPDFNALQNSFDRHGTEKIVFYAFDVPFLNGKDLRSFPQGQRNAILRLVLATAPSDRVRMSEMFDAPAQQLLESACAAGLEGIMAKRPDAPYSTARSPAWLKLKCSLRQEFVIGGFTDRSDGSPTVGSLLLGVYGEDGQLVSTGSVGTGWDAATAAAIREQLMAIEIKTSPFDAANAPKKGRWSRRSLQSERWVEPILVAEVQFAEWTPDGSIRHASFKGMRTDKDPAMIRRERPV